MGKQIVRSLLADSAGLSASHQQQDRRLGRATLRRPRRWKTILRSRVPITGVSRARRSLRSLQSTFAAAFSTVVDQAPRSYSEKADLYRSVLGSDRAAADTYIRRQRDRPPVVGACLGEAVTPVHHQQLSVTYAVMFVTVVAMLGPGVPSTFPGTPESVREYVWPGRTSVTVH